MTRALSALEMIGVHDDLQQLLSRTAGFLRADAAVVLLLMADARLVVHASSPIGGRDEPATGIDETAASVLGHRRTMHCTGGRVLDRLGMASGLWVPVVDGEHAGGVIRLTWRERRDLDDIDLHVADAVAARVSQQLLHDESHERGEQHRRRQRIILEVAAQVTGDLDLTALATSIVDGVTAVTEFGAAVLTLRDGDGFRRVAASGLDEPRIGLRTEPSQWQALLRDDHRCGSLCYLIPPDEIAGDSWVQVIETPRPIRQPLDQRKSWTPEHGLVVELLDDAGAWVGFLSVAAPSTGLLPDEETVELLELFARQAQAGLASARLLAQASRQRDAAEALSTVGRAVSSSLDLREVLRRCCDAVIARSVGDRASIYLHDPDAQQFRTVMSRGGEPDHELLRTVQQMPALTTQDAPVFAEAARTGHPVLVEEVTTAHVRRHEIELFSLKSLAATDAVGRPDRGHPRRRRVP